MRYYKQVFLSTGEMVEYYAYLKFRLDVETSGWKTPGYFDLELQKYC